MGYSKLASIKILSPNHSGHRTHAIDSIVIDCMCSNISAEKCGELFSSSLIKASSNYGIGSDGTIGLYVDEANRSWCTSSEGVDQRSVTIEVASTADSQPYPISDQAYEALITLLVDICNRNKIKKLKWKGDVYYARRAAAGGPVTEQNMFAHKWFDKNKPGPGDWLYERQGLIADEVNQRLNTASILPIVTASLDSLDGTSFNPYVAVLDRYSPTVDYSKFEENRIVGAIVEAGYLFDSYRTQRKLTFESSSLRSQIAGLQSANLPFGLYTVGRGKSASDAQEEMYQFSFPLRRYSPKLGAWIQLDLRGNKATNDDVLDRYRYELVRLGFQGQMGIMCDMKMLEKISWSSFQNDFNLYLVDHVSSTSELDGLLQPEFFDVQL